MLNGNSGVLLLFCLSPKGLLACWCFVCICEGGLYRKACADTLRHKKMAQPEGVYQSRPDIGVCVWKIHPKEQKSRAAPHLTNKQTPLFIVTSHAHTYSHTHTIMRLYKQPCAHTERVMFAMRRGLQVLGRKSSIITSTAGKTTAAKAGFATAPITVDLSDAFNTHSTYMQYIHMHPRCCPLPPPPFTILSPSFSRTHIQNHRLGIGPSQASHRHQGRTRGVPTSHVHHAPHGNHL